MAINQDGHQQRYVHVALITKEQSNYFFYSLSYRQPFNAPPRISKPPKPTNTNIRPLRKTLTARTTPTRVTTTTSEDLWYAHKQLYSLLLPDIRYSLVVPGKAIILCPEIAVITTEILTTEPPAVVNGLGFRV